MINRDGCKDRVLYRIHSRNLEFGVFDSKDGGFIGLREKFGHTYPFKEFHYDNGAPYGTVRPEEALPERLPDDILLGEYLPGSFCSVCQGEVEYNGKDKWFHLKGPECEKFYPRGRGNPDFGKWLHEMEEKYGKK